jgi:trans-aconitate methyltransferase
MKSTKTDEYAQYLIDHQLSLKSKFLQLPYALHLRFLNLGKTLDVGCGAGRNLKNLSSESIGVDHNSVMIKSCCDRGMNAYSVEEWQSKKESHLGSFDSLLFSHIAEHMTSLEFESMLRSYLPLLKKQGRIVVICPQESGYQSDQTHIEFMDFKKMKSIFKNVNIEAKGQYSYPFPRSFGKIFRHNEFVSIGFLKTPHS